MSEAGVSQQQQKPRMGSCVYFFIVISEHHLPASLVVAVMLCFVNAGG